MSHKSLFVLSTAVGTLLAVVIYGVVFDELSETTLVLLTPVWFFPLVFGLYGLLAIRAMRAIDAGRAESLAVGAAVVCRSFGLVGMLVALPFVWLRGRRPVVVAAAAAGTWAVLLEVFFVVVFPEL